MEVDHGRAQVGAEAKPSPAELGTLGPANRPEWEHVSGVLSPGLVLCSGLLVEMLVWKNISTAHRVGRINTDASRAPPPPRREF